MTRDEWVLAVGRKVATSMPDEYPEAFAYYMAESYAREGGYAKYIAGHYPEGVLWMPEDMNEDDE